MQVKTCLLIQYLTVFTIVYNKIVQFVTLWVNFSNSISPTMRKHSFQGYFLPLLPFQEETSSCSSSTSSVEPGVRAAGRSSAAAPSQLLFSLEKILQYLRAFFNKGLFLNVSGHLKGCVGHFLPVGLEEGSTRPKCLMCDVL